jgi:cytochrome P450
VTSDLTLSTGHTLPKGTRFGVASYVVHTSPETQSFSPSYNPPDTKPPTEFDGFRFARLRAMEGKENKHQFVTTSLDSLNFGHGNHACPGRFFASNEIKVVLIEFLRNWEIRLKGDVERKGSEDKRPKSHVHEFTVVPDMFAEIDFKRRKDADPKLAL